MKRLITLLTALMLTLSLCITVNADGRDTKIAELKNRQNTAHEAAELLRELGYAESSAEIKGLSDIWHEAQDDIDRYQSMEYVGRYYVTGYTAEACRSKSDPLFGITASGAKATPYYTLAASSKDFAFGERLYIDGLPVGDGGVMEVQDRGVGSGVIDVCCATLAECYKVTGYYDVWRAK